MTRGRPQSGQRVPPSKVFRQSRQRAGIWQTLGLGCYQFTNLQPYVTEPFHGAKLAILVGENVVTILRDDVPPIPWFVTHNLTVPILKQRLSGYLAGQKAKVSDAPSEMQ